MFPISTTTKNGKHLLIREAEPADAAQILAYLEEVSGETDFLTFGPGEFELGKEKQAESIEKCKASPNCIHLVALVEDEIAGVLIFSSRNRPRIIHVGEFGITVRKKFWSSGIGSMLLDALISWAKAGELISKINLSVRTDNHRAIALYIRKGFVVEGKREMDTFIDGKYYDILLMGKPI